MFCHDLIHSINVLDVTSVQSLDMTIWRNLHRKLMKEEDVAIDFELKASDGSIISLSSFKNKKNIVLCFYPKNHLFACPSKKEYTMAKSVISAYSDIIE